jgi:hypothetical protein
MNSVLTRWLSVSGLEVGLAMKANYVQISVLMPTGDFESGKGLLCWASQ